MVQIITPGRGCSSRVWPTSLIDILPPRGAALTVEGMRACADFSVAEHLVHRINLCGVFLLARALAQRLEGPAAEARSSRWPRSWARCGCPG
ncbi:MAG TPA: hypothetical protein VHW06_21415 [Streptosporangiaceae bacterium]|nr:hypothetical protein [Streptosporangiaceae bacterium]